MASYWFTPESVSLELGGRTLTLETGRLAKQAAGAVLVTYGETVVLVTAARARPREGIDFFPLVVDFVEKTSAAGKIPGGFFKREGRLSDREVLVSPFTISPWACLSAASMSVSGTSAARSKACPPSYCRGRVGSARRIQPAIAPWFGP